MLLLSLALVASLTVTVLLLGVTVWLSLAGFIGSLTIAILLEREVRLVARERIQALPLSAWLGANARRRPGRAGQDEPEKMD